MKKISKEMKKRILAYILILFSVSTGYTQNKVIETDWFPITTEMKPWTRWWWLGSDVDEKGLTYNLEEMDKAGIGGVEITPIYGVKGREKHYLNYLSPEWMDMLKFTLSEATRLGMKVDMNTGTGWPFGGPDVSIEDAATKAFFQEYTLKGGEKLNEPIVIQDKKQQGIARIGKLMAYGTDGTKIDLTNKLDAKGHLVWRAPKKKDYRLIALFIGKNLQQVKRAAPGGEGYVLNHLDKSAVMRYLGKFEKAFHENDVPIPNCFFNDSYEVDNADWTPNLLDEFEKLQGYRLEDYFPELLADGATEASVRVISDYREALGEILKQNFTLPWTNWTHHLGAITRNQGHGSPANLLDIYASVDIPECETFGISNFDIPGLRKDSIQKKNDGDPAILKYASSAAHVTGKQYTSSETFTWLTEHFRTSLSQCKPEIDQMFTSGVNHVYFHGTTYSPKDVAWPGWKFYASIDMSPTNSIWEDASAFFSYITKVQSFLQSGQPDNDFLLYFPMHDIWSAERGNFYKAYYIHGMRERLPEFCSGVEEIMAHGYDVDYISDYYIHNTIVKDGLLETVGGITYKALILPAVHLIPLETMKRVYELAQQGATIVFIEHYPSDVSGFSKLEEKRTYFIDLISQFPTIKSFEELSTKSLGKGKIITGSNYHDVLSACQVNHEPFVSQLGGQLIRRKNTNGYHYFMTLLKNRPINNWVTLGVKAESAMIFDPMTGKKGQAAIRKQNGKTQIYLQLKPGESILLKTFNTKIDTDKWSYYQPKLNRVMLNKDWKLRFSKSEPSVSETFDLVSLDTWTNLNNSKLKRNMGTGKYTTTVTLKKNPQSEYLLSLGDVRESARVKVNGQYVRTLFSVPFEVTIGELLKDGENTIEVEVTNLPANRIADYDRRGVEWRIFHEINFVSITYKPTKFDDWKIIPSGLLGPVSIQELEKIKP